MSQEFNVIEAKFSSRDRKCVIGPLWQYDYGQILRITGIDLPENYEVHFSNDPRGVAKSIPGNANGVRIPAEYLKSGSSVFAWLYVHQGEDDGSTEYQIEITVRRRARPTSEAPDSEEKTAIGDLIEQMNAVLDDAKKAAKEAAKSAEDAKNASLNGAGIDISGFAQPGQWVRVKEVDENGKPTEWETADIPDPLPCSWNDITDKLNEKDAFELVAEMGLVELVATASGEILTDKNGTVITL